MLTLTDLCAELSIPPATGRNWVKLGKIKPESKKGRSYLFSEEYVRSIKNDLENGKMKSLKSRRNKSYVSGKLLYGSYIPAASPNLPIINKLMSDLAAYEAGSAQADNEPSKAFEITESVLRAILYKCASQLILRRIPEDDIYAYMPLLEDLRGAAEEACDNQLLFNSIFSDNFEYIPGEDTLGLIYISLKHLRARKSEGTYYTPGDIVQRLLGHLFKAELLMDGQDKKILDPGCGTGNFLLCLPPGVPAHHLYGYDIDEISIQIARINLALKYKLPDNDFWKEHLTVRNFLHENRDSEGFDVILGNPPWGSSFPADEKKYLKERLTCAKAKSPDSFDLFTEQAIHLLNDGGILSYVLPESILLVKTHRIVREILLRETALSGLEYLGDVFDHVQCPSVILQVTKSGDDFLSKNPVVYDKNDSFRITTGRKLLADAFDFLMPDEEYSLLNKMESLPGVKRLEGNAEFALGIVTGANKEMLKSKKSAGSEVILKGTDIFKYSFRIPKCYIRFEPEKCQQVAPVSLYRAPEKLLYRFIGGHLVFAYDDRQTLSLNSCNIVIPNIEGLSKKYILAILNSSAAQYYFVKEFRSVKILRSHIEQIPIPFADDVAQKNIIGIIDSILALSGDIDEKDESALKDTHSQIEELYFKLDEMCFKLFNLSDSEIKLIKDFLNNENLFLPV